MATDEHEGYTGLSKPDVVGALKARAEAAEQRVRELREAREKDLDHYRTLDRDLTKALEKAGAAEAKLATAVETLHQIDSTSTRWCHKETGERLVAIAVKRNDEASLVLPVYAGIVPHPLDWMPEKSFLREFEAVEA